ncbi:MAG: nickel pincer cofactor biosynthesis protein LarC [Acidimicrobiales bacterium]|nr:nickel pincer cofactor biosynthesis protein LarC [Acidimicrobiales bacterium]
MTTTAWFHPFSGIAGDMALGACLDAGADLDEIRALLEQLPVDGWHLDAEDVLRGGIAATHAVVHVEESTVVRTAEHITALIEEARLPERVRDRSLAVFHLLAEVEGRLHRRPPSQVHFHEVGGVDAIVDVVGTCAGLEVLGIDRMLAGPVATGTGMTRSAHGMIPVPAPAVVELLRGAPVAHVDVPHELTTPTGAALLAAMADRWGPMPAMTITASGYGAGSRDLDGRVNAVQLVIGETAELHSIAGAGQPLVELSVNVDDATGETLAHAVSALLDAGAADAWIVPVLMKKGRPGHMVCALVDEPAGSRVAEVLTKETGSFGVRARPVDRWPAARSFHSVAVDGHPIRIKVSPGRTKVEHDDAADVARRTGRPLREVVSLAEEAARRRASHPSDLDFDPDEPA